MHEADATPPPKMLSPINQKSHNVCGRSNGFPADNSILVVKVTWTTGQHKAKQQTRGHFRQGSLARYRSTDPYRENAVRQRESENKIDYSLPIVSTIKSFAIKKVVSSKMNNKINHSYHQRPPSMSTTAAAGLGLGSAAILSGCSSSQNAIQLRKALSVMFPHSYIRLYHQPPHSVCSLFSFKQVALPARGTVTAERDCNSNESYNHNNEVQAGHRHNSNDHRQTSWSTLVNVKLKPSSEPSSRVQVLRLQDELEKSLVAHQAKPVGLCPVRRAIFDQCFDEIIRQVTIGCIERGLLLFKIRNELRMTVNAYRRLYESAIGYKLGRLFDANLQQVCKDSNSKAFESDSDVFEQTNPIAFGGSSDQSEDSISRLKDYYEGELAKKDEIIRQQRTVMRALNLNSSQPSE